MPRTALMPPVRVLLTCFWPLVGDAVVGVAERDSAKYDDVGVDAGVGGGLAESLTLPASGLTGPDGLSMAPILSISVLELSALLEGVPWSFESASDGAGEGTCRKLEAIVWERRSGIIKR